MSPNNPKHITSIIISVTALILSAAALISTTQDSGKLDNVKAEPYLALNVNKPSLEIDSSTIDRIKGKIEFFLGKGSNYISSRKIGTNLIEVVSNNTTGEIFKIYFTNDLEDMISGIHYSDTIALSDLSTKHSEKTILRVSSAASDEFIMNDLHDKFKGAIERKMNNGADTSETETIINEATRALLANRRDTINATSKSAYTPPPLTPSQPDPAQYVPQPSFLDAVTNNQLAANNSATASLPRNNDVVDKKLILKELADSNWIQQGDSKRIIYMFTDFQCPACKQAHQALSELGESNISIRYVPVGALGMKSTILAALSLVPSTNKERLTQADIFLSAKTDADISFKKATKEEIAEARRKEKVNLNLLVSTKKVVTPLFAFNTESGPIITTLNKEKLKQVIHHVSE